MKIKEILKNIFSLEKFIFFYSGAGVLWLIFSGIIIDKYVNDLSTLKIVYSIKEFITLLFSLGLIIIFVKLIKENLTAKEKLVKENREKLLQEIEEAKEQRREIFKLSQKLKIKNKELENILYITTHDLRSPLVNIIGFNSEVENSLDDLLTEIEGMEIDPLSRKVLLSIVERDIKDSQKFIKDSGLKMDRLLSALLKYSRIGRKQMKIEKLDINQIVRKIVTSNQISLRNRSIGLTLDFLPDCYGDEGLITIVFENIIKNSIQYSRKVDDAQITIEGIVKGAYVQYSVSDNGIGIDEENLKNIFQIFSRFSETNQNSEGLGLAIAKKIVERHNGEIWAESKKNSGTAIHFTLPIEEFENDDLFEKPPIPMIKIS